MKMIIRDNERGFLFKNGTFVRMVMPGKRYINKLIGQSMTITKIDNYEILNEVDIEIDINILLKDKNFADSVTKVEVPDYHIVLHFIDGRVIETLSSGVHYFWNVFHNHTFQVVDISKTEEIKLPKNLIQSVNDYYYTLIQVSEGEMGLLFIDGEYRGQLTSGSHYYWNGPSKVSYQLIDLRIQQLDISSQEILTADKVTLRLNFVCTYRITDPVNITNKLKDYKEQIYITTQLAIREYIGNLKFDELLENKNEIANIVLEKLKVKEKSLFIEFVSAGLKDIILPGEVRDIMNTVLIAEKHAQANVISRREEVASTRSLLNTAKLMDENSTLYKLKELEYLERICDRVGSISVGNGDLLGQLGQLLTQRM